MTMANYSLYVITSNQDSQMKIISMFPRSGNLEMPPGQAHDVMYFKQCCMYINNLQQQKITVN